MVRSKSGTNCNHFNFYCTCIADCEQKHKKKNRKALPKLKQSKSRSAHTHSHKYEMLLCMCTTRRTSEIFIYPSVQLALLQRLKPDWRLQPNTHTRTHAHTSTRTPESMLCDAAHVSLVQFSTIFRLLQIAKYIFALFFRPSCQS